MPNPSQNSFKERDKKVIWHPFTQHHIEPNSIAIVRGIVVFAAFGWLGAAGAMIAAVLHNLSTLLVLGNAGRLLRFQEPLLKLDE